MRPLLAAKSLTDFRSESSKAKNNARRPGAAQTERGEKDKGKSASNRGRDGKGDRNRSSHFRKDYEERKKGGNHRDRCYLCDDSSHTYKNCPKLGKLAAMMTADNQSAQTCPHPRPKPADRRNKGAELPE
ncbi:hypothetical protein HAX54_012034, partial [Datura stramonium]|nr:hypothetical protein [Datura stramonium]